MFVGGDTAKYALPCHFRAARYNYLVKFSDGPFSIYSSRSIPLVTVNHALTNWGNRRICIHIFARPIDNPKEICFACVGGKKINCYDFNLDLIELIS